MTTAGRVHVNWIRLCYVQTGDCNVIMFNATIWFDGSSLMIGYMIIVSFVNHHNNKIIVLRLWLYWEEEEELSVFYWFLRTILNPPTTLDTARLSVQTSSSVAAYIVWLPSSEYLTTGSVYCATCRRVSSIQYVTNYLFIVGCANQNLFQKLEIHYWITCHDTVFNP